MVSDAGSNIRTKQSGQFVSFYILHKDMTQYYNRAPGQNTDSFNMGENWVKTSFYYFV